MLSLTTTTETPISWGNDYLEAMNLLKFWTSQSLRCRCEFRLNFTTVLSDEPASTLQPIPQSTRQPDEWLGGSHILTCLQPDIIFMRKNYFDGISHDHLGVNLIQPEIRPTCLNSCSAIYEALPLPFHFASDFYL